MKAITEKTSVRKNMRGLWEGETFTTVNGQTFEITTMKRSSGELVSTAMRIEEAGEGENIKMVSFSSADIFQNRTELICRRVRATERAVREQHAEAVILFDEKAAAGEINGLKPADEVVTDWIGQVIFTDMIGGQTRKRAIYEVERTKFGTNYKSVLLDGSGFEIDHKPRPYSEKFGTGVYYNPGERITQEEINDLLISAHTETKERHEREREEKAKAAEERARKIEEGKKLVNIPTWAKSVIVADLYQDDSDIMTDYFSTSVSKRVYLAWSRSDRNNIKELHKAKLNFEDTAELEGEHTRGHSYLPDYFVGSSFWSGWKVHKDKGFFTYNKKASPEALYIAAAEGRVFFKEEEKAKPEPVNVESVQYIDYSDKAFAIVGDTRKIKDQLKELGGRWNSRLSCGAGWIFSKARSEEAVKEFLNL